MIVVFESSVGFLTLSSLGLFEKVRFEIFPEAQVFRRVHAALPAKTVMIKI
jgi:hypothetical protein